MAKPEPETALVLRPSYTAQKEYTAKFLANFFLNGNIQKYTNQ